MVAATWALPDGSTQSQFGWTTAGGSARFETTGPRGTFRLDVTGITKSLYTFNPRKSVLTGSVTVP